jgi:hypothetical protein
MLSRFLTNPVSGVANHQTTSGLVDLFIHIHTVFRLELKFSFNPNIHTHKRKEKGERRKEEDGIERKKKKL